MQLKTDPFAAVRVAEYRNLLIGRFMFIMGLRMMATLIGWWIYLLTNDPFAIGLVGLSEVLPALSLALYAGHVIDQSEKRKLLLKGVVLYFLAAIALVFISGKYLSRHLDNHWIAACIYFVIFCKKSVYCMSAFVNHRYHITLQANGIHKNKRHTTFV